MIGSPRDVDVVCTDGDRQLQRVASPARSAIVGPWGWRAVSFGSIVGLTLIIFRGPIIRLVQLASQQDEYSHVITIPVICAWLFVRERRRIFSSVQTCWLPGLGMLSASGLLYWLAGRYVESASGNDQLSIAIFAVVLLCIGCFILCYGLAALTRSVFPLLFLFLIVPMPEILLSRVIFWLQSGSAEVSDAMFQMLSVPVFRTGFTFFLPGISIEIARECSGIRSSVAMLIVSLLAGHLFLRSPWTKALLTLTTLPLLVIKNGIRIVTLTLLSVHLDRSFLTGNLHHRGGIVFFVLALGLLAALLWSLQRLEQSTGIESV